MDEPTATVTGKADACVSAAFLAQHHTGVTGHDARDPMSTIAATGSHQMPVQATVAPWFAKYYGAGTGARTDEPAHTVTVNDRFAHVQADLQTPPFGEEHHARAREVAEFLRAQGARDGGEFVTLTIEAQTFVVVDIGMRMLTPRELFNAQGFPADYAIDGHWVETAGDWTWKPFPKDVQVSCCGNSVCPDLARALVEANCTHLMKLEQVA
jgi:DNA (cytosine-5)-methyltransferase 1